MGDLLEARPESDRASRGGSSKPLPEGNIFHFVEYLFSPFIGLISASLRNSDRR